MKVLPLGLQTSLVTSYDQTKTTLQGRIGQRIINDGNGNKTVIGPNPISSMDIFDDTGLAPTQMHTSTVNGRIFIGLGIVAGVWTVAYYQQVVTNGNVSYAWQGNLKFNHPFTTVHTIKGFKVDDSNPSSMTFIWTTTNATAINGGLHGVWGVPTTDFAKVSVITYPAATTAASLTKTVYLMGDNPSQASQTLTVADGVGMDISGQNVYILNGASATPKIYKFSYSLPPSGTITAGYTNSNFTFATGVLPVLSGTVLLVNNVQIITPQHTANAGSQCLAWLTSTNIYLAKTSDITSGASSLPSLQSTNLSNSSDYLTPATITMGQYISSIDKWALVTVTGTFTLKQCINNDPNSKFFGSNSAIKTEVGGTVSIPDFGGITYVCLSDCNGFLIVSISAIGQRGALSIDMQADENSYDPITGYTYASIISPVVSGNFSQGVIMGIYYELAKRSVKATIQYRLSNFSTAPGAGFDATWTTIPKDGDLSSIVNASQAQFRILFSMINANATNPPQINEAYFVYTDLTQSSNNWVGSSNNTSASGANPFHVAFRLQSVYPTSVPKLFVRGIDDSGNAVVFDTVTNISNFEFSNNNGTSWTALGTIPNTALTTEVRFNWTSPDGVARRWSVNEQ